MLLILSTTFLSLSDNYEDVYTFICLKQTVIWQSLLQNAHTKGAITYKCCYFSSDLSIFWELNQGKEMKLHNIWCMTTRPFQNAHHVSWSLKNQIDRINEIFVVFTWFNNLTFKKNQTQRNYGIFIFAKFLFCMKATIFIHTQHHSETR